jgi:hypothetical protein
LLKLLRGWVEERTRELGLKQRDFRFTRRELRAVTHWGDTQLKVHLGRLVELEYVRAASMSRRESYVYELAYDGDCAPEPHLAGLIDADALEPTLGLTNDTEWSEQEGQWSEAGRPVVGGWSGTEKPLKAQENQGEAPSVVGVPANAPIWADHFDPAVPSLPIKKPGNGALPQGVAPPPSFATSSL